MNLRRPQRVLVVIPLLALVVSGLVVNAVGPYNLGGKYDPEYVELFNGLSLVTFHTPVSVVRPGTTLHELAAGVILVKWALGNLWGNWTPLEVSAITRAEDYLHAINLVLNVLLSLMMYLAALTIYRLSGSLAPALALQGSWFLFWQPTVAQGRVWPELLLVSVIYLLMIVLARTVWAEYKSGWNLPASAGALYAVGVVTKLSFMPLVSIVLLFKGRRRIGAFAAGAVAAGTLVALPVLGRIAYAVDYFWKFFSRSGFYGYGSAGLPGASVLRANAASIVREEPFLIFLSLVYVAVLLQSFVFDRGQDRDTIPNRSTFRMVVLSGLGGVGGTDARS